VGLLALQLRTDENQLRHVAPAGLAEIVLKLTTVKQ
jgi:hypothetical protein